MQMKVRKNEYKSHISLIPTHRKEVLLQTWAAVFACKQGRISTASTGAELSTQCQLFCKQDKPISKEWAQRPQLTPPLPSDSSIQGFLTCSCRGFDPPWTSMA